MRFNCGDDGAINMAKALENLHLQSLHGLKRKSDTLRMASHHNINI
jgi:hypothetical protein